MAKIWQKISFQKHVKKIVNFQQPARLIPAISLFNQIHAIDRDILLGLCVRVNLSLASEAFGRHVLWNKIEMHWVSFDLSLSGSYHCCFISSFFEKVLDLELIASLIIGLVSDTSILNTTARLLSSQKMDKQEGILTIGCICTPFGSFWFLLVPFGELSGHGRFISSTLNVEENIPNPAPILSSHPWEEETGKQCFMKKNLFQQRATEQSICR